MPNITEIADGEPNPNTPTIKELRESHQRGAEGQGTSEYTYAEKMAQRNHGVGVPIADDSDGEETREYKLPWSNRKN